MNDELKGIDNAGKFAASLGGIGEDSRNAERLSAFLDQPIDSAGEASLADLYNQLINEVTQGSAVSQSIGRRVPHVRRLARRPSPGRERREHRRRSRQDDDAAADLSGVGEVHSDDFRIVGFVGEDCEMWAIVVAVVQIGCDCIATRLLRHSDLSPLHTMSSIIPIPTTRVGDYFVRQRLIGQVQNDQLDLFKLQNQISTGQRLQLPSDDAPAALRAINLQRLLDRKGQIQTNVQANNHFLSAAETNLSSVSDLLINLRAETVGVAGTLSSDAARQTLVQQIDQALETLVATGNAKLQGRYLFAGSRSQTSRTTSTANSSNTSAMKACCGATWTWSDCSTRTWPARTCLAASRARC